MGIERSNNIWRVLIRLFFLTLALYICGFYGLEHIRDRKGPWVVTFDAVASSPTMIIEQKALGINGFKIIFENVNN